MAMESKSVEYFSNKHQEDNKHNLKKKRRSSIKNTYTEHHEGQTRKRH